MLCWLDMARRRRQKKVSGTDAGLRGLAFGGAVGFLGVMIYWFLVVFGENTNLGGSSVGCSSVKQAE